MTGAWTTQAIAVTAELGIADHLASEGSATGARLATLTDTDQDRLSRLLRLVSLGIVRRERDKFHLAELGQLLRSGVEYSLRPLALIYGGSFYQSFGHLMSGNIRYRWMLPCSTHVLRVVRSASSAERYSIKREFKRDCETKWNRE